MSCSSKVTQPILLTHPVRLPVQVCLLNNLPFLKFQFAASFVFCWGVVKYCHLKCRVVAEEDEEEEEEEEEEKAMGLEQKEKMLFQI